MEYAMIDQESIVRRKKALRRAVLAARDAMKPADRDRASCLLAERVIGHQWFYRSDRLLAFASFGSEIGTDEILKEALSKGKKVYLPLVEGEDMQFYQVASLEELQKGYRGIREPSGNTERYVYRKGEQDRTLMLMPGVAFDPLRRRLGYGKGFYDRFLSDKEELLLHTIAMGFDCQLVEEVPAKDTDLRPYQVIIQR